jgi:hypothetical protein
MSPAGWSGNFSSGNLERHSVAAVRVAHCVQSEALRARAAAPTPHTAAEPEGAAHASH